MIISQQQRVAFDTGSIVAPEDLDAIWLYAKDVVDDAKTRRFAKGILPMQAVEDVATPYTQALNVEERTFRFISPVTCIIERGFFNANMTCTGEVTVNITDTAGATPAGCTVPWLSTKGAVDTTTGAIVDATTGVITSNTDDIQAINVDRFVLTAGTEYKIIISGTANFTLNRFDLVLHVATDRWMTAGTVSLPTFDPTLLADLDGLPAATANANNAALTTASGLFPAHTRAPLPWHCSVHNFVAATSVNRRKFRLPRFDSTRATSKIIAIYLFAFAAGPTTITATLRDQAGVTVQTLNAVVAGTQKSASLTGISQAMTGGIGVSAEDATDDYTIEISNNSATNCVKATCLVWFSRA